MVLFYFVEIVNVYLIFTFKILLKFVQIIVPQNLINLNRNM